MCNSARNCGYSILIQFRIWIKSRKKSDWIQSFRGKSMFNSHTIFSHPFFFGAHSWLSLYSFHTWGSPVHHPFWMTGGDASPSLRCWAFHGCNHEALECFGAGFQWWRVAGFHVKNLFQEDPRGSMDGILMVYPGGESLVVALFNLWKTKSTPLFFFFQQEFFGG